MYYYAMSDIHGYLDILQETMKQIDLRNSENKLFLLGDYIDYGPQSFETLSFIHTLTKQYPHQVIALKGNHEEYFLDWLHAPIPNSHWFEPNTIQTFLATNQLEEVTNLYRQDRYQANVFAAKLVQENHKELTNWLRGLPLYYETPDQIFVHAGIDEEAEDLWKFGTPDEYFTQKYPATQGYFLKDIIAGHIGTCNLRQDKSCYEVYWDKKSHYYIDGATHFSGFIPILKYDTTTKQYSSFRKEKTNWKEYMLR